MDSNLIPPVVAVVGVSLRAIQSFLKALLFHDLFDGVSAVIEAALLAIHKTNRAFVREHAIQSFGEFLCHDQLLSSNFSSKSRDAEHQNPYKPNESSS